MSMNHKKKRKKIVFFGDSITEQGLKFGGYIKVLQQILRNEDIEEDYELTAAGISGDKVYDLYLRMGEDILAKGADIVVIFVGINDVWHKFSKLTGTSITSFQAFYIAIIEKLLSVGIQPVLCTPAVIGESPDFLSELDEEINLYCEIIRELAIRYELPLVDLRKAFIAYNRNNNHIEQLEYGVLTVDKVHLNDKGNQLVAREMWKILKDIKLK